MMTVDDINESLVGKRIEGNFGGEFRQGTVIDLLDEKYTYGFVVKVDKPVFMMSGDFNADTWYQDTFEVEVRKYDNFDWGALKSKTIISDSVKQNKTTNMKRIKDYADYEGQDLDYNQIYEEATDELINMKRSGRTYGGWRSVAYFMGFNLDSLNDDDLETLKDAIEDAMMDNEDLFVQEPWKYNRLNVSDSRRVKDNIKTKVSIRKRISDAFDKYINKDLNNLQAYRRVTDSEGRIKEDVVFLIEDSDVFAVFPNTYGIATRDRDTMVCYSHNGQHGVCTYDYANTLKTAVKDNYQALQDELTNYVGYNLTIVDSLPSETDLKKNAQEIRDSYKQHKRHAIIDERLLARGEEIEYNGKRGTVQYALFHGQGPVVIRWQNEDGSEEFKIPYNQVTGLKIHDSEDADDNVNVEQVDSDVEDAEVTDNCGKGKKKAKDSVKKVKVFKRDKKA